MAEAAITLEQLLSRLAREGELYEPLPERRVHCYACAHRCVIPPGQRGVCKVRWNEDGRLVVPAGYVAGLQLDPVEKKPFFHAYPGARALSFGMLGCDYHCAYCFTGDTPVLTPTGFLPISAIFDRAKSATGDDQVRFPDGVNVIAASGAPQRALKVFRHRYCGPLTVIKPMYLPSIRCTPHHRWLATTDPCGRPVEEVRAKDLTPDHFLLVPKQLPSGKRITLDVATLLSETVTTVSRDLAYGIATLVLQSGRLPSIYVSAKSPDGRILGRAVRRQSEEFSVVWYRDGQRSRKLRETDSQFLVPVRSVAVEAFDGDVYNLDVEEEHSYVAGFCAVKNCQNALTSQALRDPAMGVEPQEVSAVQIADAALRHRARILTSTYNEPLITSEWAVEVFKAGKARGLTCSYVSNGNATPEVLDYLRPWVDLYKVDLKGFDDRRYRKLGGVLQTVLDTIRLLHAKGFWLEVVTLLIPGFNDSDGEVRDIARFLASVSADIPWHVTAFHPDYKMTDRDETPVGTLIRAAEIGLAEGLRYVYAGNLPERVDRFENTYCASCRSLLIERVGYTILSDRLTPTAGRCPSCSTRIPGVWG